MPRDNLNVVVGHVAWSDAAMEWHTSFVERARAMGWNVESICLTPSPPAPRYSHTELDSRWQAKDRGLVKLRGRLREALKGADVFWNYNGANVPPAWLSDFPTLNVYGCFDDPESSEDLSKPVARYYDAALVGNLACLPLYQSWGVRHLAWAPLAFIGVDYDPALKPEDVLSEERPVDVVFFGEREMPHRQGRLDALAAAFPEAMFRGRGWPGGFVPVEERRRAYRQARIGWNLHNSVGPVNLRFFALLAAGVLQICDNRCRTGQVLDLDKEIVGFDTIEECVDRTRYYLDHEAERREIAANGLRRYQAEFAEEKLWERFHGHFRQWLALKREGKIAPPRWTPPEPPSRSPSLVSLAGSAANRVLQPFGIRVERRVGAPVSEPPAPVEHQTEPSPGVPYVERPEAGARNWSEKRERLSKGECFEWPNIVALNWACAALVGDARRIVELGGGTGCFAYEAAAVPNRTILCSDLDEDAIAWAREHRRRDNIDYVSRLVTAQDGEFDLVVAIDVIEHVADYVSFLRMCCALAPRAILTTPNRRRSAETDHAGPPEYYQHVREWSAGEFYWVLRSFYQNVSLYAMPSEFVPAVVPIQVTDRLTPLIAVCEVAG
jgi:spore maturation protein CgeB